MAAAFTYTTNAPTTLGGLKVITGTYTSIGGGTGGDINTGLTNIYSFVLQSKGSAVVANAPVVNETLPKGSDGITIVTTANEVGTWVAFGE